MWVPSTCNHARTVLCMTSWIVNKRPRTASCSSNMSLVHFLMLSKMALVALPLKCLRSSSKISSLAWSDHLTLITYRNVIKWIITCKKAAWKNLRDSSWITKGYEYLICFYGQQNGERNLYYQQRNQYRWTGQLVLVCNSLGAALNTRSSFLILFKKYMVTSTS